MEVNKTLRTMLGKSVVEALKEQGLLFEKDKGVIIIAEPFIYHGKENKYIKKINSRRAVLNKKFIELSKKINDIEIIC